MESAFAQHKPTKVVNLAAQAGVRYSLENPAAHVQANLVGFGNVLEVVATMLYSIWCMQAAVRSMEKYSYALL